MFRVCHAFLSAMLSVHCRLVITYSKRASLLALSYMYVMFYCVCATFSCGVLGQGWYMLVSIPDLWPLIYFGLHRQLSISSVSRLIEVVTSPGF